jgi:hypothetical protein
MMYLNFSALETALLPAFLFVVYTVLMLWVRSESLQREYVEPDVAEVEVEPELQFPQDFVLSVPSPWVDQALSTALSNQFELEVLSRQLSSTSNHFTREAVTFLIDECGLPKAELETLAEELDKVSPPKSKRRSKGNSHHTENQSLKTNVANQDRDQEPN